MNVTEKNDKLELIMMRGFPGSGKSTYAKKLLRESPNKYIIVSTENIRNIFFNGDKANCNPGGITYWTGKNSRFGKRIATLTAEKALNFGYSVIVDGSNLSQSHESKWKSLAEEHEVEFRIVEMDTPYEECLRRNAARENPVPEENLIKLKRELDKRN